MVAYVVLANFTEQGIRNAKESPKRAHHVDLRPQGWARRFAPLPTLRLGCVEHASERRGRVSHAR